MKRVLISTMALAMLAIPSANSKRGYSFDSYSRNQLVWQEMMALLSGDYSSPGRGRKRYTRKKRYRCEELHVVVKLDEYKAKDMKDKTGKSAIHELTLHLDDDDENVLGPLSLRQMTMSKQRNTIFRKKKLKRKILSLVKDEVTTLYSGKSYFTDLDLVAVSQMAFKKFDKCEDEFGGDGEIVTECSEREGLYTDGGSPELHTDFSYGKAVATASTCRKALKEEEEWVTGYALTGPSIWDSNHYNDPYLMMNLLNVHNNPRYSYSPLDSGYGGYSGDFFNMLKRYYARDLYPSPRLARPRPRWDILGIGI